MASNKLTLDSPRHPRSSLSTPPPAAAPDTPPPGTRLVAHHPTMGSQDGLKERRQSPAESPAESSAGYQTETSPALTAEKARAAKGSPSQPSLASWMVALPVAVCMGFIFGFLFEKSHVYEPVRLTGHATSTRPHRHGTCWAAPPRVVSEIAWARGAGLNPRAVQLPKVDHVSPLRLCSAAHCALYCPEAGC